MSSALREGDARLSKGALAVEFESVTFAYPTSAERPVLRDLSFRLPVGRVLGIVGRTGSGKSTIARLLFRFYDPSGGVVRLNGTDARDVPLCHLRSRIALVTQEVQLFRASVRDNLTLFEQTIPDARLLEVVGEVGLGPWLRALPHGLETELTPRGGGVAGLSGGEAQLLALARVCLQEPDLVILDEPSSRLDPATERQLETALDRLLMGRTAIVIAHRASTLRRVDRILRLNEDRAFSLEEGHVPAERP